MMSPEIINLGSAPGAGDGDDLRTAFGKVNENFANVFAGNVLAANIKVYSVAGRTGNVVLAAQDILGAASTGDITNVYTAIAANTAAANAYADGLLATVNSNLSLTGGTHSNINLLDNNWGNLANLSVTGPITASGGVTITNGVSADTMVVTRIIFGDSTSLTSAGFSNLSSQYASLTTTNANITAANANIARLFNNIAITSTQVSSLNANVTAANINIASLFANTVAQETEISALRANIAAANLSILNFPGIYALNANVAAANLAILAVTANVTAANVEINSLSANAAVQEIEISALRANISDSTANISSISANLNSIRTSINANVAAANLAILAVTANVTAANLQLQSSVMALDANAASQETKIIGLRANISAANTAILNSQVSIGLLQANAASQETEISDLHANITAANSAIATRASLSSPVFTGVVGASAVSVTGNISTGNLNVTTGVYTTILSGQVITALQPSITQIGTLGSLSVSGNIAGVIATSNQPYITGIGTLGSLTVSGNITSGNVSGSTGQFTNLQGTLLTPAQTNITAIGTLSTLAVTGNIAAGNIDGTKATFSTLTGTLLTASQPNITAVGTLSALTVLGNVTTGNLTTGTLTVANAAFGNISGTLLTPGQPNITTVGTLGNLAVTGNVNARWLIATGGYISGILITSSQPNITNVGTLGTLAVIGNITAGNVSTGQIAAASVSIGNTLSAGNTQLGQTTVAGNLTVTGNLNISQTLSFRTLIVDTFNANGVSINGNLVGNNASFGNTLTANVISAALISSQGTVVAQGNIISANVVTGNIAATGNISATNLQAIGLYGTLASPDQPNITSIGTLTGLTVAGPVRITGNELISTDLYVTGNLYVGGNQTTVNSAAVTTNDLTVTLANGAVTAAVTDGAGLFVATANAALTYDYASNSWVINRDLVAGNISGNAASFSGKLTAANVVAGNLYTTGNVFAHNVSAANVLISNIIFDDGSKQNTSADNYVSAANLAIQSLGANISAANTHINDIDANLGSLISTSIPNINSNVAAANLAIQSLSANISAANTHINDIDANLGSLISTSIPNINSNVAAANTAISTINSNVAAANLAIQSLSANIGAYELYANANIGTIVGSFIPNINSNVAAANIAIAGKVSAYNSTLTGQTTADSLTANTQITAPYILSTGNVNAVNNLNAPSAYITNIHGTIQTGSQQLITQLGTLITLDVAGNLTTESQVLFGIAGTRGLLNIGSQGQIAFGNSIGILTQGAGAIAIGGAAANAQSINAIAIGTNAGTNNQGTNAVAIGVNAGSKSQAVNAIAIGNNAGVYQTAAGIVINATGTEIDGNTAGFVVAPVRNDQNNIGNVAMYNPATAEFTYANTINISGNMQSNGVVTNDIVSYGTIFANALTLTSGTTTSANSISANVITGNITATGNVVANQNLVSVNTVYGVDGIFSGNVSVGKLSVAGGSVNLSGIAADAGNIINLRVSGTTQSISSTTGAFTTAGGAGIAQDINIGGNSFVGSDSSVQGSLSVTGYSYLLGNANIGSYFGQTNLLGQINFGGNADTASLTSDSTNVNVLNNTSNIQLGTNAANIIMGFPSTNVTINSDLTLTGVLNANLGNYNSNIQVKNNFTVSNFAFINSEIVAYSNIGSLLVTSNTTAVTADTGALQVLGGAGIIGSLQVGLTNNSNANVTIWNTNNNRDLNSGGLIVKGGTAIVGNLQLGGNANVWSTMNSTGNLSGALRVAGGASVAKDMYVGGATTLYGGLTAYGTVTIPGLSVSSLNNTVIGNLTPASAVFTTVDLSQQRPPGRPAFKLDFANNHTLDPRISFTRDSIGTYVNADGLLAIASAGQPRFHHDYQSRPLGLLVESSRQNLYLYSAQLTNAAQWIAANATISAGVGSISPDGSANAVRITDDTTNTYHGIVAATGTAPAVISSALYTASVFVKPGTINQISLVFDDASNNLGGISVFDLYNGAVLSEGASYNSSIETWANGWFRVSSTISKTNTSGNILIGLATAGTSQYLGTGTGYADVYGFQLEAGSFATTYIPTAATTVTRAAEVVAIRNNNFTNWYQGTQGTIMVDAKLGQRPTSLIPTYRSVMVSFDDTTVNNRVQLLAETQLYGGQPIRGANLVAVYGGNYITLGANVNASGNLLTVSTSKISAIFASNSFSLSLNANAISSSSSGLVATTFTEMLLGSGPGGNYLNGTISKFMYYGTIVTPAQLLELSRQ